ncbi:50S ribosomal protein L29 [Dysgonomonas sp. 25]|uniref:50S ribosomal protein L29 n=1 Tax=Dysgonomonas sp. 25 TaxID=2302933 RepID=UPI0013CF64A7|nr:50S ribosomal protein L29 [Dysgonomonas sp. 25]NDV69814.1 50S ribosomal protein L29 [Dysgonomonas sp. 25]
MKIAEVRELSDKELLERLDAERIALTQMKLNHSVSPLDSSADIKKKRRDIARFLTELRQRGIKK